MQWRGESGSAGGRTLELAGAGSVNSRKQTRAVRPVGRLRRLDIFDGSAQIAVIGQRQGDQICHNRIGKKIAPPHITGRRLPRRLGAGKPGGVCGGHRQRRARVIGDQAARGQRGHQSRGHQNRAHRLALNRHVGRCRRSRSSGCRPR